MLYKSTRGHVTGLTFEEALLSGYAGDGGLYMPESIPSLSPEELRSWASLSYKQLLLKILPLFISADEIPQGDLERLVERAYGRFRIDDVVRVTTLGDDLHVLELFHGPTLAFKDLALSVVGQLYEHFLERRRKYVTVVVGTSGDTGSAAMESVLGLRWVDIVVLYPKDRCSEMQELQMTTSGADNVHMYRVEGTSDDLDLPIKRLFLEPGFSAQHGLCGINSINWARVLLQVAHFFYTYFRLGGDGKEPVEVAVPTGACGNCTGGCIAQEMGLPVRLVCCVNHNDVVHRTIATGDLSLQAEVVSSYSSAMDIQIPYNIERVLYIKSGGDSALIEKAMKEFEAGEKACVPRHLLEVTQTTFSSHRAGDAEVLDTMRWCWDTHGYILCPHTATAVHYYRNRKSPAADRKSPPLACVATASHVKFREVVEAAGIPLETPPELVALRKKTEKYEDMRADEDWDAVLRQKIKDITASKPDRFSF